MSEGWRGGGLGLIAVRQIVDQTIPKTKQVDSAVVMEVSLLELPQQAALAFIGAEGGWVWKVSLMSPEMFSCVDHTNCEADLRNMTEHGIAVREACDNEFCATCNLAGQCDSACGYCAATIVGLQPFELVATLASVAAVAWIFISGLTR